jgi:hypothetical protein
MALCSKTIRKRGGVAEIIAFPVHRVADAEDPEIDLLTAVDAAIRDLRDIARGCGETEARRQADECREMLEQAFRAATG